MQPLGLVWESKAKHFSMCWTEWRNHLLQAPGQALAMTAQEPFSLVCCKLLLDRDSFFTREPVSSTTLHSRHCSSCIDPWVLLVQILGFALYFCWISLGFSRLYNHLASCILTAPFNLSWSSNLLSWCSGLQVINQELRVLAQILIPEPSSHTADHHTSSLMAQPIFQHPYDAVIQSGTHQFSYKSTVGDYIKVLGKVKIYNIHKFPLVHTAIHHTLVTGTTEITSL